MGRRGPEGSRVFATTTLGRTVENAWKLGFAGDLRMAMRLGRLLVVAAMVGSGTGCVATARCRLEVGALHGIKGFDARYEAPELQGSRRYELIHLGGRTFEFNSSTRMAFLTEYGASDILQWRKIILNNGTLLALPLRAPEPAVRIPLAEVQGSIVEVPSLGRTFLTGGLVTASAGLLAALGGFMAYALNPGGAALNGPAVTLGSAGGIALIGGLFYMLISPLLDLNSDADADRIPVGTL